MKLTILCLLLSFSIFAQIPTWYHSKKVYDYERILTDEKKITETARQLEFKHSLKILIITTALGNPDIFQLSVDSIMEHNNFTEIGVLIIVSKARSKIRIFLGDSLKVSPLSVLHDSSKYYNEDYQKIVMSLLLSLDMNIELEKINQLQKKDTLENKAIKQNYTLMVLGIAILIIIFLIVLLTVLRKP